MSSAHGDITPEIALALAKRACRGLPAKLYSRMEQGLPARLAEAIIAKHGFIRLTGQFPLPSPEVTICDSVFFIDYSMFEESLRPGTPTQLKHGLVLDSWENCTHELARQLVKPVAHSSLLGEIMQPHNQGRVHVFDPEGRASIFHLTGSSIDICYYTSYHTPGAKDSSADIYLLLISADENNLGLPALLNQLSPQAPAAAAAPV